MKMYLLPLILILLFGCTPRKAAVREHILLEEFKAEEIAILPLEFSKSFVPKNQSDCEELKSHWDRNFPKIFYEEFQPREGMTFLFPEIDFDPNSVKGLSSGKIMNELQVDSLWKYKVYDYKDYEKAAAIGFLGIELVFNTIVLTMGEEDLIGVDWGKDCIVISLETYYRDSFVWESTPKYFNASRFRGEMSR